MLNKIMLIGNLGRDPEMSYTPAGKAITKFSLAVNRRRRNRDTGDQTDETTWFRIVAWDQLAETMNRFLHKGSKVYIEGRMESHDYTDKDGVKRTAWEVTATDMQMLDPKGAGQGSGGPDDLSMDEVPFE
jgi:single-strand DNA-binding protein